MTRAACRRALLGEQAVQPGDADVVEPVDGVAHQFGGDRRLLGHRQVGRAGARHQHRAGALRDVALAKRDRPRRLVILRRRHLQPHGVDRLGGGAGDQQRVPVGHDALGNRRDLGRRLADAQDDLGEALANLPWVSSRANPRSSNGAARKARSTSAAASAAGVRSDRTSSNNVRVPCESCMRFASVMDRKCPVLVEFGGPDHIIIHRAHRSAPRRLA